MLFEELIREERLEAIAETVLEFLQEIGEVPKELQEKIMNQMDKKVLKKWVKLAAKAETIEQFQQQMDA